MDRAHLYILRAENDGRPIYAFDMHVKNPPRWTLALACSGASERMIREDGGKEIFPSRERR